MWPMSRVRGARSRVVAIVLSLLLPAESIPQGQQTKPTPEHPTLRVDVELVTLSVAVSEQDGKPVPGLRRENFRVLEDGVEQKVRHFSTEDRPFSMGMVLDRSGSMSMMMEEVYQAAFHTVRASKAEDEFFILLFSDTIEERQRFSTDRRLLERQLGAVSAGGATALYDAVLAGLEKVQRGRYEKKALLVVTDGEDNRSLVQFAELIERARQVETPVYVVGLFGAMISWPRWMPLANRGWSKGEKVTAALLQELADVTGGRAYFPKNMRECERACIAIAEELRQQYDIGYYPEPRVIDGSWRPIRVELLLPSDMKTRGIGARARAGYYARP